MRTDLDNRRLVGRGAIAALFLCLASAAAQPEPTTTDSADARMQAWLRHPQRVARAVRADLPPVIDGALDETAWMSAPVQTGFTQRDPVEGAVPSQRTEFRLLFDDEALYVGITCFDAQPDSISVRLTRRDRFTHRDAVTVHLNPHHDHKTGFFLDLGVSGAVADGIIHNDDWFDTTWDGVWEGRTSRDRQGWYAEYRIPYQVLRFSQQASHTWGIGVFRRIARHNEWVHWPYVPRGVSGWISRFAHLEGIEDIDPPRSLEVLPVALGRTTLSPGAGDEPDDTDLFSTVGVDVRYGLSPSISLNGTVNPDFGQVEADPAVLNLGVFETFFRERRPFFLEGISLFEFPGPDIAGIRGPARLFHSRRIGRQPSRFDLPDDTDEVERPDNTTILGAVKVSGKTRDRTAFAVLNAVTGNEYARIDEPFADPETGRIDTVRRRFRVEPTSSYFVGRVQRDLLTSSRVGAQLTAVNGDGFDPAYVGAVDGELKWSDNRYRAFSRITGSRTGQDDDRGSGYEGLLGIAKVSGRFGGDLYVDARSTGFDANDLGFMDRNDRIQAGAHVFYDQLEPTWFDREAGYHLNYFHSWNYDGDRLSQGFDFNMWHELHSYWGFWTGLRHSLESFDDLGTRGGPVMVRPASTWWGIDVWTDDRHWVEGWLGANVSWGEGGRNRSRWLAFEVEVRPASNVEIDVEPGFEYRRSFAQWVENVDDDGDEEDDHFVFGELENRIFEIGARGTYAFTPQMSLELYLQPFVTAGNYGDIKELARPRSYEFTPYAGLEDNPDFRRRALRFNLVMRWEYQPGSTLFVVWQQNRDRDFDDVRDPGFRPLSGVGKAFTDDGDNIFLVKLNRWLGL